MRNYRDLVSVTVDVDTSELQERLDSLGGIDENRVRELIAEDGVTDESVRDIVREMLADDGVTEDRVREIFSEMAHDEGEQFIRDTISGEGYIAEQEVRDLIDDAGYATEDDVRRQIRDALDEYTPDSVDEDDVRRIAEQAISEADNADIRDLERRFDTYAGRVDRLVGDTETAERLNRLEARLDIMAERLGDSRIYDSTTLFDLLTRAARILGILR